MVKRTLYFGNPAYLSLKNGQLVLRLPDVEKNKELPLKFKKEAERTIPVEDIGYIVLDHKQITLTQGLLEALIENNVAVVSCNSSRLPSGLFLPLAGSSIQSEHFQEQIKASTPLRKHLWQQTVQSKIRNQAVILARYRDIDTEAMNRWADDVNSGDTHNLEARAAVFYWQYIFDNIPDFKREREGMPPNNLLNYGYAILRAVIARALVCSGLLPTFGIHHHNRYNAYCLADDIMEPYRPIVDELVIKIMKTHRDYDELTLDIKAELLAIPTVEVNIDGKRKPLMVAASTTTASLYKCYTGELRKISYPDLKTV